VRDALDSDLVQTEVTYADGGVLRWKLEPMRPAERQTSSPKKPAGAPAWLRESIAAASPAAIHVAPSQFDPADAPASPFVRSTPAIDPRLRGDLVHRLLHRLPDVAPDTRRNAGLFFLACMAPELSAADHGSLVDEAIRVIEHPDLADLFGAGSRAEVDLLAQIGTDQAREISGRIDRLAVSKDQVTVADFKTGRAPVAGEDAPRNYVRQLAVYREVLRRIYPNGAMRCLLIWTESATIREIPAEALDAASSAVFTAT
jgi:ATP-dependent helicase/nuclease subunit A